MGARPSSFKGVGATEPTDMEAAATAAAVERIWSKEQQTIFWWFEKKCPTCGDSGEYEGEYGPKPCYPCLTGDDSEPQRHAIVRARAGTGKSTTIVEGVRRMPEDFVLVAAFNARIAAELTARLDGVPNAEAKTLHSLGYAMVRRQWLRMPVCQPKELRSEWLTDAALAAHEQTAGEKVPRVIHRLITQLHTKGREMHPLDYDEDTLTKLAFRFDLAPAEHWGDYDVEFVVLHALAAMHTAATVAPTYAVGIDFADMLCLPLMWNLTARDYQAGVVDEAQDMTVAQLELFRRSVSGRICVVGDDRQAIYGFRGADSNSINRLKSELQAVEFPLRTTYRCGQRIVAEAQRLVPDIVAADSNPEGIVRETSYAQLLEGVRPGDVVLSRLNAPLVSLALRLWRNSVRARVAGRGEIDTQVRKVLDRLKLRPETPIETVVTRIDEWRRKRVAVLSAYRQFDLIATTEDMADVLCAMCEDVGDYAQLLQRTDRLFTDSPDQGEVLCSSIHKAKGLEWERVWLLRDTLYTRGDSPEERNLEYVAVTRAKLELVFVTALPAPRRDSPVLTGEDTPF